MQISITDKELDAIREAMSFLSTSVEGSSDQTYIESVGKLSDTLGVLLDKCCIAKKKADLINAVKREYKKKYPGTPERIALMRARQMIKQDKIWNEK